jgi:hypothetical protein
LKFWIKIRRYLLPIYCQSIVNPMKISKRKSVPTHPRNPFVAAALLRKAGSHRPSNKAVRAQHKKHTHRAIHEANSHE